MTPGQLLPPPPPVQTVPMTAPTVVGDGLGRIRSALPAYAITAVLGEGAWGVVYAGSHRKLARDVAIKHLPRTFSDDDTVVRRFAREARLAASFDHPHVVPVYDYVEQRGLCLLVMQRLTGGTVADKFANEGFTLPAACAVSLAVASALHAAHLRGVLHRDVKPANLLLDEAGTVKLADFGVAKTVGGDRTLATLDGAIIGTPAYMAPEQALGEHIGPPADVYGLGAVLYELVSGELTVGRAETPMEVMAKRVSIDPVPLTRVAPEVPPAIAEVAMRAVERSQSDRYPDAESFGVALGAAANRTWGGRWLEAAGVPLRDAGPIAAVAQRPGPDDAGVGGPAGAASTTVRVRPRHRPVPEVVQLDDVDRDELVEVKDVLHVPRFPWVGVAMVLALLTSLVTFGLRGPGAPERPIALEPGSASLNGQDVAGDEAVTVDFGEPLRLEVAGREVADGAAAELRFDAGGLSLGSTGARPVLNGTAELHAATLEYVTSGPLTAELLLFDSGGDELVSTEFAVENDQPAYATIAGVGAALALLFALAHAESLLRPLRRGRRRVVSLVSLVAVGAALGAALAIAGWAVGTAELTAARVAVSAVLGSAFAAVLGWTVFKVGRRRRIRRANERDGRSP